MAGNVMREKTLRISVAKQMKSPKAMALLMSASRILVAGLKAVITHQLIIKDKTTIIPSMV
jgi:hypothetical protein